jgi:hypothetical protein
MRRGHLLDHRLDDAIMMEAPMRGSSNEREASREQRENRTDFNQEVARLQRYVTGVSRSCPELWKRVDEMRARPDWPTWCFLPTSEIGRLIGGMREVDPSVGAKLNSIAALAGWRVTQGVYRFDPDLFDSVWHTPLDTQIPGEVLFRLPEWCVYIMTPGCVFAERSLGGFFAYQVAEIACSVTKNYAQVVDFTLAGFKFWALRRNLWKGRRLLIFGEPRRDKLGSCQPTGSSPRF